MRLVTVKEACAYTRLGKTRLYQGMRAGTIVAYKEGKKTLIDLDAFDASLVPWKPSDDDPAQKSE
jgi:excisionase family DNA binding protein